MQILQSTAVQDIAEWTEAFKSQMPLRLQDISKVVSKDQSTSAADVHTARLPLIIIIITVSRLC